jgi:hypothetical protein
MVSNRMFCTEFMMCGLTLDSSEKWIAFEQAWYTETKPTLNQIYNHIHEWEPFLINMEISFTIVSDTHRIFKIQCKDSNVFEITSHTDKYTIILPKWTTMSYMDIIRILSRMFKRRVVFENNLNPSTFVKECTRTMHYINDYIALY